MNENRSLVPNAPGWFAWSTRDILLVAVIGVVFGLLSTLVGYIHTATFVISPIVAWVWTGLYILPTFFIAYILRRIGAAFLVGAITGLVMLPTSLIGPGILITAIMYGVSGEIAVALATQYRRFNLISMAVTGMIGGVVMMLVFSIPYPDTFIVMPLPILIGVIAVVVLGSGICAVLAKLLADALALTGVLSGTMLKAERTQEV